MFNAARSIGEKTAVSFLADLPDAPTSYHEALTSWKSMYSGMPFPEEKFWDVASTLIDTHTAADIHLVDYRSDAYPKSLRLIDQPPPVLFLRGNPDTLLSPPGVAIVGTRDATDSGRTIAFRIAAYLGERGWTVVSGLALGIDRAAHEGALSVNAKTVAVLAHGLQHATPKSNAKLADAILEQGGSWVAEHPLGVPAQKQAFLARNRIQIGLSAGSIIVEADVHSGSMAQARFCVSAKRPLFAVVPTDFDNPLGLNCTGTLHMVNRMGAFPIRTRNDYADLECRLLDSRTAIEGSKMDAPDLNVGGKLF